MKHKVIWGAAAVAVIAIVGAIASCHRCSIYNKTIKLNDGTRIPQLGIGTFNAGGDENARRAVKYALENGVRMIDTAHAYNDERGVGQGIIDSGVPRKKVWITSKIWPNEYGGGKTLPAIDEMLGRLQTDYIDLLLIHQPVGDYVGAWKEMEEAVRQGKVRSIGISNFDIIGFDELMAAATIKPSVLQVECHPYYQQREMREKIEQYGMKIECWYPLGGAGIGNETLFNDPTIVKIAQAHGKSPAQIILRWHMQAGYITMPGSIVEWQIKENINIGDFKLTDAEMEEMNALDRGHRFYQTTPEQLQRFISGWKVEE